MKKGCNILITILLFSASIQNGFAQADHGKTFSYGIWIHEYQKGWIDSENTFWLLESSKPFRSVDSQFEVSTLCRPLDFMAERCCYDETFSQNEKELSYSGEVWEVRQFFDSRKTKKFKFGDKTLKIIKLDQSNCKCSYNYVDCYRGSEKAASIFNYKFLELSKEEKKSFRRNKRELVEYLEKMTE